MAAVSVLGIPGIGDLVTGIGTSLVGGILSTLLTTVENAVASVAAAVFNAVENLVNTSAGTLSFSSTSWWGTRVDAGGRSLWPTMISLALAVLVGCLILAVIQGALAGDPMTALKAVAIEMPKSIFGMVTVVAITAAVCGLVDSASAAVLSGVGTNTGLWFSRVGTFGAMGGIVLVLGLVGAVLTWIELVIRQGLIFVLVALSPMVLAARVWPTAAGIWKRLCEVGVALILSKFAIAVAMAVGADALGGAVDSNSLTAETTGAVLMLLSAFSPFVLLRLIPGVEGAMAAQGISRMPARTAMTAVSISSSAALLSRAGGGFGGAAGASASGGGQSGGPGSPGGTYGGYATVVRPSTIGRSPSSGYSGAQGHSGAQGQSGAQGRMTLGQAASLDVNSRPGPDTGPSAGPQGLPKGPDGPAGSS